MSNYYLSRPCPCGGKIQACDNVPTQHAYTYICDDCKREWTDYDDAITANDRATVQVLHEKLFGIGGNGGKA